MLLLVLVSPVLGANCYVVAPAGGRECVIVDPGFSLDDRLDEVMAEQALRPAAALITHGHIDHTFGLSSLCQRHDLPVYVNKADAYRLTDPVGTLGGDVGRMFAGLADGWTTPPDIRPVTGGQVLDVAGLTVRAIHAPGHTEGSTLYHVPAAEGGAGALFTGDVLFAGTIGRTDLPGGDDERMLGTLAELATPESSGGLPDATAVLAGHGERSTLGQERAANPYLRQLKP